MPLPASNNIDRAALPERVAAAGRIVADYNECFGWAQLLEVAEELGYAAERVKLDPNGLRLSLSDLQLVAFAAALRANAEALSRFLSGARGSQQ